MSATAAAALPEEAYATALLTLPGLWPSRMAALLGLRRWPRSTASPRPDEPVVVDGRRSAADVWDLVRSRRLERDGQLWRALGPRTDLEEVGPRWARAAAEVDVGELWARHVQAGVAVDLIGSARYPTALAADEGAPFALFRAGATIDLTGRCVAIVGTRRCTPAGREIAQEFGEALGRAGARVVSGLALGIDGAAHEGALRTASPPIGVVAGGIDRPYPARHRTLWGDVRRRGVLVSEWPLGTPSEGWRFPARNRIIAALAEAVVVVESRATGGSVITADQALTRNRAVFAVPGSVRSPASVGTNQLLRDGAIPACGVEDVIDYLGLHGPAAVRPDRPAPDGSAGMVLEAVDWDPTPIDVVLRRCAAARSTLTRAAVALELAHLELDGWVQPGRAGWQRVPPRPRG